jgi:hypothetical protein
VFHAVMTIHLRGKLAGNTRHYRRVPRR